MKNFVARRMGRLEQYYDIQDRISSGGRLGCVRCARDKKSGLWYAVRDINKEGVKRGMAAAHEKMNEEIKVMRVLDHPNIVHLYESFEDRRKIHLVFELCEGGQLLDHICLEGRLTESVASSCVRQMFLAVNYLHQNLVVHRNLKCESWLLAKPGSLDHALLKLADFHHCRRFCQGKPMFTKVGTPSYMAPEVISGRYSEKVDVWSLGVTLYILLSGNEPFGGKNSKRLLRQVQFGDVVTEGQRWSNVSDDAKNLVKTLLLKSPSVRPKAQEVLRNARWLQASGVNDGAAGIASLGSVDISQLRAFRDMHKLKKAALHVIATQLTDERIEGLRKMFLAADRNCDGTVCVAELKESLQAAGMEFPHDLSEIMAELDCDGSGVLDYTEFIAATMDWKWHHEEEIVWEAFRKFDRDNSGTIDRKELARVLGDTVLAEAMGKKRIQDIFAQVDGNGDGVIDFEEFLAMMRKAHDIDSERPSIEEPQQAESIDSEQEVCRLGSKVSKRRKEQQLPHVGDSEEIAKVHKLRSIASKKDKAPQQSEGGGSEQKTRKLNSTAAKRDKEPWQPEEGDSEHEVSKLSSTATEPDKTPQQTDGGCSEQVVRRLSSKGTKRDKAPRQPDGEDSEQEVRKPSSTATQGETAPQQTNGGDSEQEVRKLSSTASKQDKEQQQAWGGNSSQEIRKLSSTASKKDSRCDKRGPEVRKTTSSPGRKDKESRNAVQDPWGSGSPRSADKGVRCVMLDGWQSPVSKLPSAPARADQENLMLDDWGSPVCKLRSAPATADEASRIKDRLVQGRR